MHRFSKAQRVGTAVTAAGFAIAGSLHFIKPEPYIGIMPPWLPWHAQLVAVSGFFEIAGGLGLLIAHVAKGRRMGPGRPADCGFPREHLHGSKPCRRGRTRYCSNIFMGEASLTVRADLVGSVVHAVTPTPVTP